MKKAERTHAEPPFGTGVASMVIKKAVDQIWVLGVWLADARSR
jgi:hypothetical protein